MSRLWIGFTYLLDYSAISNWFASFSGNIKFPDTGPQHLQAPSINLSGATDENQIVTAAGRRAGAGPVGWAASLLNVSYDPTRELYKEINPAFIKSWQSQTGGMADSSSNHTAARRQAGPLW